MDLAFARSDWMATPAAEALLRNILLHVSNWEPAPVRTAVYVGDPAGRRHPESSGLVVTAYDGEKLAPSQVLIVGAGGGGEIDPCTVQLPK